MLRGVVFLGSMLLLPGCGNSPPAPAPVDDHSSNVAVDPVPEQKIKQEQIEVFEKMAEEYEKVKDKSTMKKAHWANNQLEERRSRLNLEYSKLPAANHAAFEKSDLKKREIEALKRLSAAKKSADELLNPPEEKLINAKIEIYGKMAMVWEKATDKESMAQARAAYKDFSTAIDRLDEEYRALSEARRMSAEMSELWEKLNEARERARDARKKANQEAAGSPS
jgi:hypothetical protein